jgi:hypothetical protein
VGILVQHVRRLPQSVGHVLLEASATASRGSACAEERHAQAKLLLLPLPPKLPLPLVALEAVVWEG